MAIKRHDAEAIIRMAKDGLPPRIIAKELGIKNVSVSSVLFRARKCGEDIELYKPTRDVSAARRSQYRVRLHTNTSEKLKAAADLRGLHERDLIVRILTTAVDENMIDAILDDA